MSADRAKLQQFVSDLAMCIDDGPVERMASFFAEKSLYLVIPKREYALGRQVGFMRCESRAMIEDRLAAMTQGNIFEPHQYRHLLGNAVLDHEKEGIVSMRTPFMLVRTAQDGVADVFAAGKYVDKIAVQGETLEIRERIAVLDSHRIDTLLVLPI